LHSIFHSLTGRKHAMKISGEQLHYHLLSTRDWIRGSVPLHKRYRACSTIEASI
jgi:hypothetical protein